MLSAPLTLRISSADNSFSVNSKTLTVSEYAEPRKINDVIKISKIKGNKDIILSDPNKLRLKECSKYLEAKYVAPNDKEIASNNFDIVFDTVGLEISRQQAIEVVKPGGTIIHIGLTQPAGTFNFRKMTLQEVTVIGTYCYTNKDFEQTLKILANKDIGSLDWIEFRDLKSGGDAFKQIHDGTCVAPKIILLP